jgi:hypothetical protein
VDSAADPLRAEREAYVALSSAVTDSLLDARLVRDQPERYRETLSRTMALQVDRLAAHDRFVHRAERLGVESELVAKLREGRADLALMLQRTQSEVGSDDG